MLNQMRTEETNNPEIAKKKIIGLLERAENYIWISTGLSSEFYNDAELKSAMTEAFKRVREIRIIIDGNADIKKAEVPWLFNIAMEIKQKLQIREKERILHWLIVDGRHFRLEKKHYSCEVGTGNIAVCNAFEPIPKILMTEFDKWWFESRLIKY